ncbi:DinB family protein [Pseudalkalibacillus hwajinpoensis]|uniref:DinB family protein n=1 Tax=Guptibacillus hwajinpoensis TaxID=208199 RepID=A0A4U1MCH4_9BACL|nr:DinB family protein [Pseudalkalibacillus hwajinpoensis]TKD68819.1 DinB family protein [Pseudalkalibacillus hwajinpoensis]
MTDQRSVLNEYASLTDWLQETAMKMSEEVFFKAIKPGKWSPAEIISHIRAWDDYLMQERIPYLSSEASLKALSFSVEEVNSNAAVHARSGLSRDELINETINERQRVVNHLKQLERKQWADTFYIDKFPLCLTSYIKGLIEHDEHHKLQIEVFMSEHGLSLSLNSQY